MKIGKRQRECVLEKEKKEVGGAKKNMKYYKRKETVTNKERRLRLMYKSIKM